MATIFDSWLTLHVELASTMSADTIVAIIFGTLNTLITLIALWQAHKVFAKDRNSFDKACC